MTYRDWKKKYEGNPKYEDEEEKEERLTYEYLQQHPGRSWDWSKDENYISVGSDFAS